MVKGNGCDRHGALPSLLPSETHIFCWRGRWSDLRESDSDDNLRHHAIEQVEDAIRFRDEGLQPLAPVHAFGRAVLIEQTHRAGAGFLRGQVLQRQVVAALEVVARFPLSPASRLFRISKPSPEPMTRAFLEAAFLNTSARRIESRREGLRFRPGLSQFAVVRPARLCRVRGPGERTRHHR